MTYSPKFHRQKSAHAIRKWRREWCEQVGACDVCRSGTLDLLCHELPRGNRKKCLTEPAAILVLCWTCHDAIHDSPAVWPKVRQAALLKVRRPEWFDLSILNSLLIRKLSEEDVSKFERDWE